MEPILPDLHRTSNGARPKVNGISSNGHAKSRSPLVTLKLPATACRPSVPTAVIKKSDSQRPEFEDTPAITRTPSGMREFWRLDQEVYPYFEGPASPPQRLVQELANYGPESNVDSDDETLTSATTDGEIGEKRRMCVLFYSIPETMLNPGVVTESPIYHHGSAHVWLPTPQPRGRTSQAFGGRPSNLTAY
jgi:hypothetical protein